MNSEGKVEDGTIGWSQEDLDWLAKVRPELQPIARRHGKKLFQFTMKCGAASHSFMVLAQSRDKQERMQALMLLQKVMNEQAEQVLKSLGFELKHWQECSGDVERMAALADAGQTQGAQRVSPGGLILDS